MTARGLALAGLTLLLATARAGSASGPFYYYEKDGRVVFTNRPGLNDAKRLPKLRAKSPRQRSSIDLPATAYDRHIGRVAAETGLSPALIKSVALVESGFNPKAVSPKGARGLMQLMPATAASYGVTDLFDPLQNLRAGARHLRDLLDEFDGDLTLALAAYNAGSVAVRRHRGVPAYTETRNYVARVRVHLAPRKRSSRPARAAPVRLVRQPDGSVLLVN